MLRKRVTLPQRLGEVEEDVRIIGLILQAVMPPVLRAKHKAGRCEEQGVRVDVELRDLRNHVAILFLENLECNDFCHWTANYARSRTVPVGGSLVKHSRDILVGCLGFWVLQHVQPCSEYLRRYVG